MLDRYTLPLIKKPLQSFAKKLHQRNVNADTVTVFGFVVGMLAIPSLAFQQYELALACILMNRIGDGIDGELARLHGPTDAGGFLDIVLDFIFYSGVVFGFALADPEHNALAASALIFSFMGTGASFLAFAIMAERNTIKNMVYPNKGFYYLGGLTEGTETIVVLALFCLLPEYFAHLAWFFASLCLLTTLTRVVSGYSSIKDNP